MRGKNVLKSTLLLSIMMMSTLAIVFPAAQAVTPAVLKVPQIIDPLKQPGQSLTVYITVANVKRMVSFDLNLNFNPAVLQAVSYSVFGGAPVYMAIDSSKPNGINNALGKVWLSGVKAWPPQAPPYFFNYYDANSNGMWDVGEKGVQDTNRNGLYYAGDGDLRFMRRTSPYGNTVPDGSPLTVPGPLDKYFDTAFDGIWTREDSSYLLPEPVVRDVNNNDIYDPGTDIVLYTDSLVTAGDITNGNPPAGGVLNYFTGPITTVNAIPVASIVFNVVTRGFSILDLNNCVLKDNFGNTILPLQMADGYFDNRFQGKLIAPVIQDLSLVEGSEFTVDITVDDVIKLWGYQFILSYDTDVLTATSWDNLGIFTQRGPWVIDDAAGFIAVAASSWFGDPTGLTTMVPVAVARIHFKVDSVKGGWSALDIHDEVMTNVNGDVRILEVFDGAFANIYVAELAGNKLRVEHRTFHQASEIALGEDLLNDVKTPIQYTPSAEAAPVTFKVVFTVYDLASGDKLGTFDSLVYTLVPHTTISVITGFETDKWGTAPYGVLLTAKILWDITSNGTFAAEGGPIGSFDFRVLP